MNAQELKEALSVSDIITYVTMALGSDGYREDNAKNPIFQTVDHNERGQGKYKLYYYDDRKLFVSYTGDGAMDIFELTQKAGKAVDFKSAFNFIADFFGYDPYYDSIGAPEEVELTKDWDLLNKWDAIEKSKQERKPLKAISRAMVEYFPDLQPEVWRKEGITYEAMRKFGIRMDTINEKIVIPHYDIDGKLVGLRGRAFNWRDLEKGAKYSPLYLGEGENITMYNHPLGENLYGINFNKDTIQETKSVVLFESEKSTLFVEGFYPNHNYTLAVCGSNVTNTQVDLILSLGVREVVIAFDKENDDLPGSEMSTEYRTKLLKIANLFAPYTNTYYIFDTFGKLNYKDSPADRGKETFEFLLKHKIFVPTYNTLLGVKKGRR